MGRVKLSSARVRIPSIGPSITESEVRLVTDAVRNGWYEGMSTYIDLFTEEFSAFTGTKYCLPTSHGTAALHLCMLALGIGPGDEVIVPDITWVASACVVDYVGARPVFADITENDWCLSPESFEACISKTTRAVVVVDLFGNMPQMDIIRRIARNHRITIIEDAAEAIGAQYKGRPAGAFGTLGVYSFNATKLAVGGQGGMLVTNNRRLYERARLFSHHGIQKKPNARYYWSHVIGYNYNWTNVQAALALGQLRRIDDLVTKRRQVYSWYAQRLADCHALQLNAELPGVRSTFWITAAIVDKRYGLTKERLQAEFSRFAIDARPFFYPISSMPPYRKHVAGADMKKFNRVSYSISPYTICLPSGANLSEDDVDYVCDAFRRILKKYDRIR